MKRIHILGKKNSGKTTLIVELVQHWTARGLRVGTVKHTHHHHELDTPGKDSHLHRQAGAAVVGILSREMNAVFWPREPGADDASRYDDLGPLFAACDLVLVEGHSQAAGMKVEVWRAANAAEPLAANDPTIHALITDDRSNLSLPHWPRSDLANLADRLLELCDAS